MVCLSWIELTSFKGVDSLRCDFDDLTALVGVNNSGKTSVLQAVYLLVSALPGVADGCHRAEPRLEQRVVELTAPIAELGLPGFDWLLPDVEPPFKIRGGFSNGCTVTLEMRGRGRFCFTVEVEDEKEPTMEASPKIEGLREVSAKLFRPPGILPAREIMLTADDYRRRVADGGCPVRC